MVVGEEAMQNLIQHALLAHLVYLPNLLLDDVKAQAVTTPPAGRPASSPSTSSHDNSSARTCSNRSGR